ncbi:M28 family peptidase [Winogradskyella sp.]|uniref:M28 family peptidase n=1 Tax=Winogradskyella sp. TaxID=1883156 RepID=UPI003F6C260B
MNKTFLYIIVAFVTLNLSYSQSIQDIIDQVNQPNLETNVAILAGEQDAVINGTLQTIPSRFRTVNDLAADFIEEQFLALDNLTVEIQDFNTSGKNVIATQIGQTNPDDIYMICAHYDSVTTYCADDNATGVAAVLEIARIMSTQCTDNTIVYAIWDEEENGLNGSDFYAVEAADTSNGNTRDNILGVINMDMIGYDGDAPGTAGDNDFDIDVRNFANSLGIVSDLEQILMNYTFDLNPLIVNPGTSASDHSRFWAQGYSAVLVGESWETNDQTPDYHTSDDRTDDIDFQYMTEITKLVAAYIATKSGLVNVDNTVSQNATSLISDDTAGAYQWYNCDTDTAIVGEINQTFTPISNGNYSVEVTNGSCIERSVCINFNTLTTEQFTNEDVNIYPNPVSSILKIDNNTGEEISIEIIDISGKLYNTLKTKNTINSVDLSDIATGVYFVKVSTLSKSSTYKIVKE